MRGAANGRPNVSPRKRLTDESLRPASKDRLSISSLWVPFEPPLFLKTDRPIVSGAAEQLICDSILTPSGMRSSAAEGAADNGAGD